MNNWVWTPWALLGPLALIYFRILDPFGPFWDPWPLYSFFWTPFGPFWDPWPFLDPIWALLEPLALNYLIFGTAG